MLPAPHVTLSMSGKIANILGPHYGWSLWKNEDLLADLVEFFCSGSAVQRSLWATLEKRVPVSEAEKTCTLFRPFRQCFCMCLGLDEQQGMFLKSKGFLRNAGHWKKHGFETFSSFEKFEKRDNIARRGRAIGAL